MNRNMLSKYTLETLSIQAVNQLQISSICNARCIFCSNNMNPFPIYRLGFRPLDDVKRAVSLLRSDISEVRLGDSLPGRISEGEALLHPDIIRILQLIREKTPSSVVQINTNGTMLDKGFIEKLIPYKPLKFTISYHSDNPAYWCKIFNLKLDKYKIARDSFILLYRNSFLIEAAIVPLPNLVGYPDIENTVKNFRPFAKEVIAYAPGYSYKASKELKKILDTDFLELSRFFVTLRKKYKMNIVLSPDLAAPPDFHPQAIMAETYKKKFSNVLWLFSGSIYKRAKIILRQFNKLVPNAHYAYEVKNNTYRGNIICSGLLMVDDYKIAIGEALSNFRKSKIDLIILRGNAFDRLGDDLQGENYSKLVDSFKIPIWLR